MSILKGKHKIKEIDEVRCTIVEKNVSKQRVLFLKKILEFNGYQVKYQELLFALKKCRRRKKHHLNVLT